MENRFDRLAAEWDHQPVRVALAADLAAAMRQALPLAADWQVIDFGAGTGLLSLNLLSAVGRIHAVDSSAGMLEALRAKVVAASLTQIETHHCDLHHTPWPGAPVDAVVSALTLHHLANVPLVLGRLAAALRPGGWMALADLDTEDGSFHGPDVTDVYHHGFAREQVADWLAAAGLSQIRVDDAGRRSKPAADGELREYSLFLAVARRA